MELDSLSRISSLRLFRRTMEQSHWKELWKSAPTKQLLPILYSELRRLAAAQVLREGVPLMLTWRFRPNQLTKQGLAPSVEITRFASRSVAGGPAGPIVVEFRDLPAVLSKTSTK